MKRDKFSKDDIAQIESEGLTPQKVMEQLGHFRRGVKPLRINRPCTTGDGLDVIDSGAVGAYVALHDRESAKGRMIKFVPASGAASRMFKEWHKLLEDDSLAGGAEHKQAFMDNLHKYGFYHDLARICAAKRIDIGAYIKGLCRREVLELILTEKGLNYGNLPKALIKFHKANDEGRTPVEEHMIEAVEHVTDGSRNCRVHFTVSDEHMVQLKNYAENIRRKYEKVFKVKFIIDFSSQASSTNTIAVDMENQPFRDSSGHLVFRPGGHGALLQNLQKISHDIVFIKNIDNVAVDRLKPHTILYKKILSGYLIDLQEEVYRYLDLLSTGEERISDLNTAAEFCRNRLHMEFPHTFARSRIETKKRILFERLNRPMRVCGMVKNEGEPGGGPFWVEGEDGGRSLQIVEAFQIDGNSSEQKSLWSSGTHFNPVDLVCGLKDFRGNSFILQRFVNNDAIGIAKKSEKGRELKALELPGLWNGSMHFWNTVFVEVPIDTFNPVKTIEDLLRPSHQN